MAKIAYFDIETGKGAAEVPFYQLKQYSKYLNHAHVKRPVWMVCFAWKFIDQPYVASTSVLSDPERFDKCYWDDYHVVKTLHDLVSDVDVLIAHNGDRFDWRIFQWRCINNGLTPPPKPVIIDTLKIARKEFMAESNTLSYLARQLGVAQKDHKPNWDLIAQGDREEIAKCEKYCRQDIRAGYEVYKKLSPYDSTNKANLNAILNGIHHHICPKCGHWDQEHRGYRHTKAGKYKRYVCNPATGGCGGWSKGKTNLKKVDLR